MASFGLDEGVSANKSVADYAPPELASSVEVRTFPSGNERGLEALIERDKFHSAFCADVPAEEAAAVYGARQRPVAVDALDEPLAVQPGWKMIPSWFVIAGADHSINPDSRARRGSADGRDDGRDRRRLALDRALAVGPRRRGRDGRRSCGRRARRRGGRRLLADRPAGIGP